MAKITTTLFKVSFTIKDNVKIYELADALDKAFELMDVHFERTIESNSIEYSTSNHNNYADMWDAIYEILESKYLAYINGVIWNNYETDNVEDVLTEYLEDKKP